MAAKIFADWAGRKTYTQIRDVDSFRKARFWNKDSDKSGTYITEAAWCVHAKAGMGGGPCFRVRVEDNGAPESGQEDFARLAVWCTSSDGVNKPQLGLQHSRAHDAHPWQYDTWNRMVFWIKPPADLEPPDQPGGDPRQFTFTFGTYIKSLLDPCLHADTNNHAASGKQEGRTGETYIGTENGVSVKNSGQGHFYHLYKFMIPGKWNQFIVDYHPQVRRESHGRDDLPEAMEYPFAEYENDTNSNYFDCLTEFYFDQRVKPPGDPWVQESSYPATWYLDNIMMYTEPSRDDHDASTKVASLAGAYDQESGRFGISFAVIRKSHHLADGYTNEQLPLYNVDVRYRKNESIRVQGWSAASVAGQVANPNNDNKMAHFISESIDPGTINSGDVMYFALKATDDPDHIFREICIPLVDGELPPHLQGAT
jgi:hypothetical protein